MPYDAIANIQIGLELDFSNDTFKGKKIGTNLAGIDEVFKSFVNSIREKSSNIRFKPTLQEQLEKIGFDINELEKTKLTPSNINTILNRQGNAFSSVLLSYQIFKTDNLNSQPINIFVTLDESVIEIIIEKTSFENLKLFGKEIQEYVYKFAKTAKLECTERLECMTHINVDFATGFESDLKLAFNTFLHGDTLFKIESNPEVVLANAPILQEMKLNPEDLEQIHNIVHDIEELENNNAVVNQGNINNFVSRLISFFKNNKEYKNFVEQFGDTIKEKILKDPLHYQAVNLQHLANLDLADLQPDRQRVEFRRYWSQENFNLTLEQVEKLCRAISSEWSYKNTFE